MTSFSRRIFEGTGVLTASGIAGRFLAFITIPILTRALGPEPYGLAALLVTAVNLGTTMALLGIDLAYLRFALQGDGDRRRGIEHFCWQFAIGGAVAAALLCASAWWIAGGGWAANHRPYSYFVLAAIILTVMATMASNRARLLGKYYGVAVATVIAAAVSAAVSVCVALFWRADAWALLFGALAAPAATIAILRIPPLTSLLNASGISRSEKLAVISLGLSSSVTAPVYWLISSSDRWFVAALAGSVQTGIYVMAAQVASVGLVLNASITMTWFPEIGRVFDEHNSSSITAIGLNCGRIIALMAVTWVAVSAAGGDVIRLLAAEPFYPASAYVPWLAAGVLFYGVGNLFVSSMFLAGKMRYVAAAWLAGGLVCLLQYYLLTNWLGPLGAAIAQFLTYLFIALTVYLVSRRVLPLPLPWLRLGAVAALTTLSVLLMNVPWASSPVMSLAMKAPAGMALCLVVATIMVPEFIAQVVRSRVAG